MTGGHHLVAKNKDSYDSAKNDDAIHGDNSRHSVPMSSVSVYRFMMIYVGRYLAVFSWFGKFAYAHL